jgi:cytosine permease
MALERLPWQKGAAPQYIGLFLWVVFFDQLGRRTLAVGGLLPSVLGAVAAGLLCYMLLYYVPAMWGFRSGQPLTTLSASTFGVTGATWLAGVLVGLAQVVWFATATYYGTDLTFRGLVSCRLMDPRALQPIQLWGLPLPNLLFLTTSLLWSYAAAMVGHYLVQVIGALMNVYPVFMAAVLAVAVLSTIKNVPQFRPLEIDPVTVRPLPIGAGGLRAFLMMIELVFGFFAPAGLLAADWGAVSQTERDVRNGGLVGVVLASSTVATLALLTVAGALGQDLAAPGVILKGGLSAETFSFRSAVFQSIGGKPGALIFLIFGLGSLAPTCYAAYSFGHRFADAWPRLKRVQWTILGTTAAWLLIAAGLAGRLETIFCLMGAIFAPMVAAMAADDVRQRGAWPGARRGINVPGVVAWVVGLSVGLVPIIAEARGLDAARFQPAAVFAFLAAFVTYLVLASAGAEARLIPASAAEPVEPGGVGGG